MENRIADNESDMRRSILVVSGGGGQNIGNVFFNIGGLHVVRQMFPGRNVQHIQDQPGYWTFNRSRTNPNFYCELLSRVDVEYVVLQGPVFSAALPKLWAKTLEALYKNGTRVIYLSSAFFRYTDEEYSIVKAFLDKYPPALISTRDSETYHRLVGTCEFVYDGICSAWYVPDVFVPPKMTGRPCVAFNFDHGPEPTLELSGSGLAAGTPLGSGWKMTFPRLQTFFSGLGKGWAYIGSLLDFRRLPSSIDGHDIIRPEHRTNPHFGWKIYSQPGGLASDEPYSYFTVYSNSKLTLSDRVHACVLALAYGNSAMLFSQTRRAALFDRMRLESIRDKPVTIDLEILETEKMDQINYLRGVAKLLDHNVSTR